MLHNTDLSYGDSTFDKKDIRPSIGRSSRLDPVNDEEPSYVGGGLDVRKESMGQRPLGKGIGVLIVRRSRVFVIVTSE